METTAVESGVDIVTVLAVIVGLILLGVLIKVILIILDLRRVVPTNQVHIVQRAKQTISYGKDTANGNTYYEFPSWIPILGITKVVLPVSVFDLDLKSYEAYDIGRLPFVVDIKAFFRIADSNMAAARVASFGELKEQLLGIVQGAVRSILANSELEKIMSERSMYGETFTKEVTEQLKAWGVVPVKNIELMDVRDSASSQVIANIMAKKQSLIEKESRTEVARNRQQAEEAEIEASREVALKKQAAKQAVGEREAEADKKIGMAKAQSQAEIAQSLKATREKEMEVERIKAVRAAEIAKEATVVNAEASKAATVVNAEAAKQAKVLEWEANKESALLEAAAKLELKTKEAEGIKAEGFAKADAEREMQLASVKAQVTLAEKIGANQGYQDYLIRIRTVEAQEAIGVEQAKNLGKADIKVIANAGDVDSGVKNVMDLFSTKGGTAVGGALEALANTPIGQKFVEKITKPNPPTNN